MLGQGEGDVGLQFEVAPGLFDEGEDVGLLDELGASSASPIWPLLKDAAAVRLAGGKRCSSSIPFISGMR